MRTRKERSVTWILLSGLGGIVIFLLLLALLQYVSFHSGSAFLSEFVTFLFENAPLIVFMGVMFMLADIFRAFSFPASLPGPLFSALGAVFLVAFLLHIMEFIGATYDITLFQPLKAIEFILFPVIFIIAVIAGYATLFMENGGTDRAEDRQTRTSDESVGEKSWDDLGREFRELVYDALRRCREDLKRK
ncbi:MAG: hypothetical protein LUQ25_02205 [Methanoregulaceae archaeon]|nr:hypothetical protein [Methanoregulaceae archaeon]